MSHAAQSRDSAHRQKPEGQTKLRTQGQSLDDIAGVLFGHCLSAFHAFQGLNQLSEDMRILSLNAELAAGRAGKAGVAVRALTQYTRQLVSQLHRLEQDMTALKAKTNEMSASTMRDFHQLRLMRRACRLAVGQNEALVSNNLMTLRKAEHDMMAESSDFMRHMMDNARQLSAHAGRIRQVADQSNGIATNIAIEAAAAGAHEGEFRTVSDTMKQYILTLQSMVERANQAIRKADDAGATMIRRLAASQSAQAEG